MMKNINILYTAFIGLAFMASCTSDNLDDSPRIQPGDDQTGATSINLITPSAGASYILEEANADIPLETFVWENSINGDLDIAPLESFIEIVEQDSSFETAYQLGPLTVDSMVITTGMLNDAVLGLGITDPDTLSLKVRIVQVVGLDAFVYQSVETPITVVSYGGLVEVVTPVLYVPGGYQMPNGWDPADAFLLFDADLDNRFEGYIRFTKTNEEFKIITEPAFGAGIDYGVGVNVGPEGTLDADGGNIINSNPAGSYLVVADLNDLVWSFIPASDPMTGFLADPDLHSWGLIGDAQANGQGWDADTDLTYSQQNGLLTLTIDLVPGELKFRADDAWDINYGDSNTNDAILDNAGDNIIITEAGSYYVEIDFRDPAFAQYKLEKQ